MKSMYIFKYLASANVYGFLDMLREKYPNIPVRKRLCCYENEATEEFRADCAAFKVILEEVPRENNQVN